MVMPIVYIDKYLGLSIIWVIGCICNFGSKFPRLGFPSLSQCLDPNLGLSLFIFPYNSRVRVVWVQFNQSCKIGQIAKEYLNHPSHDRIIAQASIIFKS